MKASQKLLLHSLGHAVLTALYVSGVAWFLFNAEKFFQPKDTVFAPITALMLFVVSATIVGTLVLGRPILLYMEGRKSESLKMLGLTVGWLLVLTVAAASMNLK